MNDIDIDNHDSNNDENEVMKMLMMMFCNNYLFIMCISYGQQYSRRSILYIKIVVTVRNTVDRLVNTMTAGSMPSLHVRY